MDGTDGTLVVSSTETDQRFEVRVHVDNYFRTLWENPSQTLRWDIPFEQALVDLILLAIGEYLELPSAESSQSSSPPSIEIDANLFSVLEQARATDAEIKSYIESKLYWSWVSSILPARFSISDATRLGSSTEVIDRVAEAESGNLWEKVGDWSYRPNPTLLRRFRSAQTPTSGSTTSVQATDAPDPMWDVFISHASEDKEEVARPLAQELRSRGLRVWYDEFSLELGDSLRRSIDKGLAKSRFGVVILSKNFLAKEWPQRELDGLTSREISGGKVILPVWHDISHSEVVSYSPVLADRLAIMVARGIPSVADAIESVIRRVEG